MQHDNKISLSQCSFCLEPPHPHPQLWFILQEEDKNDRIKKIVRNKISETFFPSTFWPPPSRVRTLKVLFGTERPKARTFLHWLMSFYFLIPGLVPKEKKKLINHETVWPRKSGVSLVVFLLFLVQKSFFWCLHGKHCRIITTNT